MADDKPIIIIKKKGGHGGHHGGAWKVAYADFVTAMMAFFMVMWLVNSADVTTKQNIASYFKRPGIFQEGSGTPLLLGQSGILNDAYVPAKKLTKNQVPGKIKAAIEQESGGAKGAAGKGAGIEPEEELTTTEHSEEDIGLYKENKQLGDQDEKVETIPADAEKDDMISSGDAAAGKLQGKGQQGAEKGEAAKGDTGLISALEQKLLDATASEIKDLIKRSPELEALLGVVDVKIEDNGLNIEIMDTERTSMFAIGSAQVLPQAEAAFSKITSILAKIPNQVDIIGHTDSKPFSNRPSGYSNWELSADRANTARRILERNGISPEKIISVVGRADRDLRKASDPNSAENRRITLRVRFEKTKLEEAAKWAKEQEIKLDQSAVPTRSEQIVEEESSESDTEEPVHAFTPEQINDPAKNPTKDGSPTDLPLKWEPKRKAQADNSQKRKTVALPGEGENLDDANGGTNNTPIFGNNPVLGPPDPFAE